MALKVSSTPRAPKMSFTLRSLAEIILKNCDVLDDALEKRGVQVPSLDDPYTFGSDVTDNDPQLLATADLACRAALQLVQIIRVPQLTILQDGLSVRHLECFITTDQLFRPVPYFYFVAMRYRASRS